MLFPHCGAGRQDQCCSRTVGQASRINAVPALWGRQAGSMLFPHCGAGRQDQCCSHTVGQAGRINAVPAPWGRQAGSMLFLHCGAGRQDQCCSRTVGQAGRINAVPALWGRQALRSIDGPTRTSSHRTSTAQPPHLVCHRLRCGPAASHKEEVVNQPHHEGLIRAGNVGNRIWWATWIWILAWIW